jgi:pyroglutamyl-peptidase
MKVLESQAKPSATSESRTLERLTRCHCIVTGFDRFGPAKFNPSEEIVNSLSDELRLKKFKVSVPLHSLVLPTCGENAWHLLHKLILELPPNAVLALILTGVSPRSLISLERFALNIRDYRIKDNFGHAFNGEKIDPDGPDAIRTSLPIEAFLKQLRRKSLPSEISNYTGSFVCNDIYYQAMNYGHKSASEHQAIFIHLPMPAKLGKVLRHNGSAAKFNGKAYGRDNQLALMRDAVLDIAALTCEQLVVGEPLNGRAHHD